MGINATKYRDRYIKRAARILPIIQMGVPFTPSAIDSMIGGAYSSKFVFYLRELGFEFSQQKDGRKIVSYTLIKEPADAATIRSATPSKARGRGGAAKTPKAKAPKVAKAPKATGDKLAKAVTRWQDATNDKSGKTIVGTEKKAAKTKAPKKSVADIKAKNLAKLKAVGERFNKANKPMTDAEILRDEPKATSFSLDGDWDSVAGLDLSKLL